MWVHEFKSPVSEKKNYESQFVGPVWTDLWLAYHLHPLLPWIPKLAPSNYHPPFDWNTPLFFSFVFVRWSCSQNPIFDDFIMLTFGAPKIHDSSIPLSPWLTCIQCGSYKIGSHVEMWELFSCDIQLSYETRPHANYMRTSGVHTDQLMTNLHT